MSQPIGLGTLCRDQFGHPMMVTAERAVNEGQFREEVWYGRLIEPDYVGLTTKANKPQAVGYIAPSELDNPPAEYQLWDQVKHLFEAVSPRSLFRSDAEMRQACINLDEFVEALAEESEELVDSLKAEEDTSAWIDAIAGTTPKTIIVGGLDQDQIVIGTVAPITIHGDTEIEFKMLKPEVPTKEPVMKTECCGKTPCEIKAVAISCPKVDGLEDRSLTCECWREYEWVDDLGRLRTVRIENPLHIYYRKGGTTNRVVLQDGTVKCLPAPGFLGCVLTWKNADPSVPVKF
jgi:hypothetical protein